MTTKLPSDLKHVYLIGIAGIGMSALARYFMQTGVRVSGYDRDRSELAKQLEGEGAGIHYVDDVQLIPSDIDLVVYTPAVPAAHSELTELRETKSPVIKRSEVLGMLSREKRCIAVAGTHGKTTTSAMIAHILKDCGLDCTAFMGGIVVDFKGNFTYGDSDWIVVEADEYDRSFLQLTPEVAVITSMDPDHLDIYGNYEELTSTFMRFMNQVADNGCILIHSDVVNAIPEVKRDTFFESLSARNVGIVIYGEKGHLELRKIENAPGHVTFSYWNALSSDDHTAKLSMPGRHNVENAIAALGVAYVLDETQQYEASVPQECALKAISGFRGIKRRFEIIHASEQIVVIDDYAHHPREIEAAVNAAAEFYRGKQITGVFQPHLYSRTKDLYKEFGKALSALDKVVLVEIYPARELPMEGVSSELIFDEVENQFKYLTVKDELTGLLTSLDPEVLLFLGAGDLDRKIPEIVEQLIK